MSTERIAAALERIATVYEAAEARHDGSHEERQRMDREASANLTDLYKDLSAVLPNVQASHRAAVAREPHTIANLKASKAAHEALTLERDLSSARIAEQIGDLAGSLASLAAARESIEIDKD